MGWDGIHGGKMQASGQMIGKPDPLCCAADAGIARIDCAAVEWLPTLREK